MRHRQKSDHILSSNLCKSRKSIERQRYQQWNAYNSLFDINEYNISHYTAVKQQYLRDEAVHSEHALIIRCDIWPRLAKRSRDD
jgi:hypothetical protein